MKRDISNKMIFGVCSGLSKELNTDVTVMRLVFLIGTLLGFGLPVILYLILTILMSTD
jgi:phage shock protein C